MTGWENFKVADLKEELKSRGIPLTGLKLKQQFIDKLNEVEAESKGEDPGEILEEANSSDKPKHEERDNNDEQSQQNNPPMSIEQDPAAIQSDTENESALDTIQNTITQPIIEEEEVVADAGTTQGAEKLGQSPITSLPADELIGDERLERLPKDLPPALKKEESQARDGQTPPPVEAQVAAEDEKIKMYDPFLPQETTEQEQRYNGLDDNTNDATERNSTISNQAFKPNVPTSPGETKGSTDAASSTRVPTPEILDDQRKRKRRSITPVPDSDDVAHKRKKTNGRSPTLTKRESDALQQIQEATNAAQRIRNPDSIESDVLGQSVDNAGDRDVLVETNSRRNSERAAERPLSNRQNQRRSRSRSLSLVDRDVSPTIHPATRSLYIRNFKRPLHIPTLRKHIISLAGAYHEDPLKVFYLDSIRTHAFVTFTSVAAASRVRNAMHGTRFPDEPMREMLWIDFIPDEKVQAWIDEESSGDGGGFGGGRTSSKKYEVKYDETQDGVHATLQPASNLSTRLQHPAIQQSTSNRMVPQDPTASAAVASGIHPSRVSQIPQSPSVPRSQKRSETNQSSHPSDPGKGFRALDELFSSTVTKPRLYYKLPVKLVIDDRLDMMRDLQVGYDQMGQSGDEGMKRYSFEKDGRGGQEEWVDKGPEFGFGKRGQERLTGGHYGGSRGRGAFRGSRRGGDSWRGR